MTNKELELTVAQLAERVALLERLNPDVAQESARAERRARWQRMLALDLDGYALLSPGERDAWCAAQKEDRLVELLRGAKPKLRDEVLERLPWARRAFVVFALAPAPKVVEVTVNAKFVTKLFTARRGDKFVYHADEWAEQCERESRLAEWLADGSLTVRELTDDETRAWALGNYLEACNAKRGLAGAVTPELPSLASLDSPSVAKFGTGKFGRDAFGKKGAPNE